MTTATAAPPATSKKRAVDPRKRYFARIHFIRIPIQNGTDLQDFCMPWEIPLYLARWDVRGVSDNPNRARQLRDFDREIEHGELDDSDPNRPLYRRVALQDEAMRLKTPHKFGPKKTEEGGLFLRVYPSDSAFRDAFAAAVIENDPWQEARDQAAAAERVADKARMAAAAAEALDQALEKRKAAASTNASEKGRAD